MFDQVYRCPRGSLDPKTCTCSACYLENEIEKSKAAVEAAIARNFTPTGRRFASVNEVPEPVVIRETTREKIERQRRERYAESEKSWAYIQENEARYAAHREQVLAKREAIKMNPNNMYWPPYNPLAPEGEKYIEVEYINPITSIAVLSLEEAQEFYKNLGGKETLGHIRDYSDLTKGGAEAYATAKGLGGLGVKASTKTINGKDWVIIRDFRRHQQTLMKGNKWGANNPKVVQAGLGLNDVRGAARYVRFNAGIEIAFAVGINAADYILRDEATLAEFVGNSAGDLAKGFVSLVGAALFTAVMPATLGVLATGSLFAVISFAIGQGLNFLDQENEYSQKMTKAVEEYFQ